MRLAALLAALLVAGCAQPTETAPEPSVSAEPAPEAGEPTETATSPEPGEPTEPVPTRKPTGPTIVVAESDFGPMLFDGSGQAIYLFDVETTSEPACYGDCATAWPPVLTAGKPVAGEGVDRALLGTTRRTNGSRQLTYGGHPLYYYAHEGPHEVLCHDVFLNGGTWYVVQPDGSAAPPG